MLFSSLLFIARFLPFVILAVYLFPTQYRNAILLVASLVFYAWGDVRFIVLMISSILVDYSMALGIEKNRAYPRRMKWFLVGSMVFNIGILVVFKYFGFLQQMGSLFLPLKGPFIDIMLPLGISFYTFQTMSYTLDVYRGKIQAERNIIDFGAYVSLFPQLIAGPIIQYKSIAHELKTPEIHIQRLKHGFQWFILGLASKVLIANEMGALWEGIKDQQVLSMPLAWLGIFSFGFQIYFDFLGYSMMAIGLGMMVGFTFMKNFDFPYISGSFTEFFKRWHISLGMWFREYVYVPLGGNRTKLIRNLLIVWLITGLWHGANWNFLLWGLYFFMLISIEKTWTLPWLKKHPIVSRIYVIFMVSIGWVIFHFENFTDMSQFMSYLFQFRLDKDVFYFLSNYGVVLGFAAVLSTPILSKVFTRLPKFSQSLIYATLFILSIAYLVDSTYNPFLYFRF